MRFGFNVITDSAKIAMEQLGVKWFPQDTLWIVETEAYDQKEREFQDRFPEYENRAGLPDELKKEQRAQGTRIWKNRDTGRYYYLIKDHVFSMENKTFSDNKASPPTTHVVSVFDDVDKSLQDSYRDILIKQPANADVEHGGVLI